LPRSSGRAAIAPVGRRWDGVTAWRSC
jgi:hypothetical protein